MLRVTLDIDPETGTVRVVHVETHQDGPGDTNSSPDGVGVGSTPPFRPHPVPGHTDAAARQEAFEALKALGVNGAARLARDYRPDRIMRVIEYVQHRGDQAKNVPGYIRYCLTRGVKVG